MYSVISALLLRLLNGCCLRAAYGFIYSRVFQTDKVVCVCAILSRL